MFKASLDAIGKRRICSARAFSSSLPHFSIFFVSLVYHNCVKIRFPSRCLQSPSPHLLCHQCSLHCGANTMVYINEVFLSIWWHVMLLFLKAVPSSMICSWDEMTNSSTVTACLSPPLKRIDFISDYFDQRILYPLSPIKDLTFTLRKQ